MNYYLVLNQEGLVYYAKRKQPEFINFPPKSIIHQEINDHKLFESFLEDIFVHFKKKEVTIFLTNELIFSSAIQITDGIVIDDEQNKFLESVPFSPDSVEAIHLSTKNDIYFFATNSELYKTVLSIAHKNDCTLKYVVPLLLFGQSLSYDQLTYDMLDKFTKQKELMIHGDFLQKNKMQRTKSAVIKQIFVLIISLCVLGAVVLWVVTTIFQDLTYMKILDFIKLSSKT